jgi:hypothetical protein
LPRIAAPRKKKISRAMGFSVAEVTLPPGAEVTFHQQFGNRKGRSFKTLLPPATTATTTK